MPIAQLQSEFEAAPSIAPPEYTWATKPAAAGNAGEEIIVTDFARSRWYSDGTYWRPVGGSALMRNWVGTGVTFSSGTMAAITAVPGLFLPADLVATPGFSIRNRVQWHRVAAATYNQAGQLRIGALVDSRDLGYAVINTGSAAQKFLLDDTRTVNTGATTFARPYNGYGQPVFKDGYDPAPLSDISDKTIILSAFGVSTDGSDIWYMDQWLTEVYA